jgi:hypothetical protein
MCASVRRLDGIAKGWNCLLEHLENPLFNARRWVVDARHSWFDNFRKAARSNKMKTPNAMKYSGIILVIVGLLLSGCTTQVQTLAYDRQIPRNQSATLIIPDGYTVTSFDGESVKWHHTLEHLSLAGKAAAIKLPSGKHHITYSFYRHIPRQTTIEQHGPRRITKTTRPRTISFNGNIPIDMVAGERYIFERGAIIIDTNDQYDQLP